MPLSEQEQRTLAQIERALALDDPRLSSALSRMRLPRFPATMNLRWRRIRRAVHKLTDIPGVDGTDPPFVGWEWYI
jgi:Protein of unknown function (DUF3040)